MMPSPPPESSPPSPPEVPPPVPHLAFKATLLLLFMLLLLGGSALYLLYARGVFERTQRLVLVADDSEGVVVGMDMTFSGFPIGRVRRIELAEDGKARILVDVPHKDTRWLRQSSVFTLERSLVGGTRLRAFSGMLQDKPLEDGAVRSVLRGDASEEVQRLLASVRELVGNLQALTASDAALANSLGHLQTATARLAGPRGALQLLAGNEADARKFVEALERANALMARMDGLAAKVDTQLFGPEGAMKDARASLRELTALLGEARGSLKRFDALLEQAQGIAANAREASTDLGALRAEVESSLRQLEQLVREINRKWPFARERELKLP